MQIELNDVELWLLRQAVFRHKLKMSADDTKGLEEEAIVVIQNCYETLRLLEEKLRA